MHILVVGAGAVGQVYARHLQLGGAQIAFYVKPKYRDACAADLILYPYRERRGRQGVTLHADSVHTDADSVRRQSWDQVWLCMSSTALKTGWFETLAPAIGNATVVNLTPDLDDHAYVARFIPEERIVRGLITFIA